MRTCPGHQNIPGGTCGGRHIANPVPSMQTPRLPTQGHITAVHHTLGRHHTAVCTLPDHSLQRTGTHHVCAAKQGSRPGSGSPSPATPTPGPSIASLARDVQAVPIKLVTVTKGNSVGASAMADEWLAKLRRYTGVQEVQVRPNPKRSKEVAVQVQGEGEKVLKALTARDHVILLDERGREVRSEDMAKLIAQAGDTKAAALVFCIGGPYGHSDAVRARANDTIRLSVMVLNHQVAHVVLLEQLYRGWTILQGEPYHHA